MTIGRKPTGFRITEQTSSVSADMHRRVLDPITSAVHPSDTVDSLDGAACRAPGVEPAWFDDELDLVAESPARRRVRHMKAREVCGVCPVVVECLTSSRTGDGIRGGRLR